MTAAPAIKGWCPTLLSPMQSGDGWLARVKPSAGVLTAAAVRLIADAARRHGNGHIDLTSRANLQVRGLSPHSAEDFAETIITAGLANTNPSLETIRNVMASPLGPDDSTASFDTHVVGHGIEAMLSGEPALWALPSKFGVLVDGGGVLPLQDITADIMVRAHEGKLTVHLDGGMLAGLCHRSLTESVKALALAFLRLSAQRSEKPRRMRALVMAVGEEAIFAAAGLTAARTPPRTRARSKSHHRIDIIGVSGTKRIRCWPAFRPHRSQCITRACRHLGALWRWKRAHHALARAVADRCLRKR